MRGTVSMYICIFRQTRVVTLVLYSLGEMLIVAYFRVETCTVFLQILPADFPLKREAIGFCVINSHRIRSFASYRFVLSGRFLGKQYYYQYLHLYIQADQCSYFSVVQSGRDADCYILQSQTCTVFLHIFPQIFHYRERPLDSV